MRAILSLCVLSFLGCTTMRPVAPGAMAPVLAELREGDRVSFRTTDAWHKNLIVVNVSDDHFETRDRSGVVADFAREDVLEIEVPRPAPGKTAGLSAGAVVGAVLGLFLAAGWQLDW